MSEIKIDKKLLERTINTLAKYVELPNNPDGVDMLIEMLIEMLSDTDCLIEMLEDALEEESEALGMGCENCKCYDCDYDVRCYECDKKECENWNQCCGNGVDGNE